ncbi:MAG TPA: hypothetical protein VFP84_24620 [Kofleriaceae bacterium]|nr:hypothetical protein [Kofleriaceae bacterium]
MKASIVSSLFVVGIVALSGCAADPVPTSIDVHWNLREVHVIQDHPGMGGGGHTEQVAGSCGLFDRATVYTQREGEPAQASPSTSCATDSHQITELPPGTYKIWVDLVTHDGTPYARSAVHQVDVTEAAQPVELDVVTDGVYLQSTWKVVSAGATIGCPGPTVQLITYGTQLIPHCTIDNPCFTTTLPCATFGGVFDAVPRGDSDEVAQLAVLDAEGAVIASSAPVAYPHALANDVVMLGELTITQP